SQDVPDQACGRAAYPVAVTLREVDTWGSAMGRIGVNGEEGAGAVREHPGRFVPSISVDANEGMEAVRTITRAYETLGIRAVTMFPAGMLPQVPINDKKMYPIYAKCVELGIAVFFCAGVPGPRLKSQCQHVE